MNLENYPKWHSIVIKIPDEMITKTKSGRVSIRKTITNLGALSTSNKMKSIKLVSSNIDTPEIIDNGVKTTVNNEKGPKQPKIKTTRKKKTNNNLINNIDDLYNQIDKTNEELKNTKKLKTKKDHQEVINKILKEYINKKRTKKTKELSTEFLKELFDYYYKNIDDYGINNKRFIKTYETNTKKGIKENEEKMNYNLELFNEVIMKDPDIKKRIIHDYEGFKKGIVKLDEVRKIIRENKIKTIKQYYKHIDKTNDLRLPYFLKNINKYLNYLIDPELEPEQEPEQEPEPKETIKDNSFYVDVSNSDNAVKLLRIIAKEKNGKIKIPLKIQTSMKLLNREIEKFLKMINMSDTEFMNRLDSLMKPKKKGGNIDNEELKKFVDAGYKTKSEAENIDGYVLDKELSTKRDKVYFNSETNKTVHTIAGTDKAKDWSNNLLIPLGLHQYSNRYKNAEKIQKEANKKYGKENVSLVSHSQSGNIAQNLAQKKLVGDENITLNPAIIGSHKKNVKVVRSSGDVVSALTIKNKKDKTYNTGSWNPFYNHSTEILTKKKKKK